MQSIVSYPNRGHWGNSSYRGNTSGHIIKDIMQQLFPSQHPKQFIEVFSGGGTGKDVAKEFGIKNSIHLDLNNGWNALTDDIPYGSDFIFSHPPYWNIISYQAYNNHHPDDLSLNDSYDDFITKLDQVNAKVYQSLLNGGRHAILIGDVRRKGRYYSIIKDMAWLGELECHVIKTQHNCLSSNKRYTGKGFIPIVHEHLLVFRKNEVWAVSIKRTLTRTFDLRQFKNITWRDLIQGALEWLGGKANLNEIYSVVDGSKKIENNNYWKEKIRQTLQVHDNFYSIKRGNWGLKTN